MRGFWLRWFAAAFIACSVVSLPISSARAQDVDCGVDPSRSGAELLDRARSLLRADEANAPCEITADGRGIDVACVARLEPAVQALEQSISCAPTLAAYNNLAVALRRQGHVLRALGLFEEILAGEHGTLSAEQRTGTTQQIERARADLAMLEIETHEGAAHVDAEVRVDGRLSGATSGAEPVLRVMVDPGLRSVAAEGTGLEGEPVDVPIRRGEVREVILRLTARGPCDCALDPSCCPPPVVASHGDDSGLAIGLGVSGGILVVAGAVVLGIFLAQPQLPGPVVPVPAFGP